MEVLSRQGRPHDSNARARRRAEQSGVSVPACWRAGRRFVRKRRAESSGSSSRHAGDTGVRAHGAAPRATRHAPRLRLPARVAWALTVSTVSGRTREPASRRHVLRTWGIARHRSSWWAS